MLYSTITYTWKGNTAFTSPHQLICIFSVDPDFCFFTNYKFLLFHICLQDLSMIKYHASWIVFADFQFVVVGPDFFANKFAIDFLVIFCVVFIIGFLLLFSMPTFPRYSKFQHWPKSLGGKPPLISWLSLKQHLYLEPSIVKSCQLTTFTDTGLVLVLVTCTCTWDQVLWRAASWPHLISNRFCPAGKTAAHSGWLRGWGEGGNVLRRGLACPAEGWVEGSGISRLLAARFFAGKQSGI